MEILGLERCGITSELSDNPRILFGTNQAGEIIGEEIQGRREIDREYFKFYDASGPHYRYFEDIHHLGIDVDGNEVDLGQGWLVCTPILDSKGHTVRLFFNDCANSGKPVHHTLQHVLALFCAQVGTLFDELRVQDQLVRSQRSLKRSDSLYQSLIHQLPAITYQIDLYGDVQNMNEQQTSYISPQIEAILGYSPLEWIQEPGIWQERLHPDERDWVEEKIIEHNQSGLPFHIECRYQHRNGNWVWIHNQAVYVFDEQGEAASVQGCMFDITREKALAEEQKQLNRKLAHAERMQSVGLLAGKVAHDLNNLLGPVLGYPDVVLDEWRLAPPQVAKDLRAIRDAAQKSSDIVQDLLHIARRNNMPLLATDLNQTLTNFLNNPSLQALLAPYANIEIQIQQTNAPVIAEVSATHLHKLLMNLTLNAAEAQANGGRIIFSVRKDILEHASGSIEAIPPGVYAVLSVCDEGEGIAESEMAHIFEPFFSTKTQGQSGTGLGLSVVYGVVRDFGGYIDVQSVKGKGTCFHVYLPFSELTVFSETPESEIPRGTGSILVVDDVQEQRILAERMLGRIGYTVTLADSGQTAVERFENGERPDLVVLDMVMTEGYDGLDTYRDILDFSPKQKCIIVSGFAANERVQEALRLGADHYISKPYSMQKLALSVQKALTSVSAK